MPLVIGAGFGITGSEITLGKGPGIIGDGITGDGIGITGDGIGIGTLTGGGLRLIGNVGPLTGIIVLGGTFIGSEILLGGGPLTGIGIGALTGGCAFIGIFL